MPQQVIRQYVKLSGKKSRLLPPDYEAAHLLGGVMSIETIQPEAGDDRHRGVDFSTEKLHEMWRTPSELEAITVPNDARDLMGTTESARDHQEMGKSILHAAHFIAGEYLG